MLIAQISDAHIVAEGRKTYGIAPMAENLARCIDHINQLVPQPDIVLVTGDLTNIGTREEADHAAKLLNRFEMPFYIVPGNHDDRAILWQVFGGKACPAMAGGFINYVIDNHNVRLIGMDSVAAGASGGALCDTRANWLEARLGEEAEKPTVIFMHHPPVKCSVLETDEDGFAGVERLGQIITKYDNIERILCGHIHLLVHARWQGTVVTTAPSMGMQLGLDLTMERPSEFFLEDPGYLLHYWTPQNTLITHTVYVRDHDGPYPFEDQ